MYAIRSYYVLNEGITISKIKTYAYHNMNYSKIKMNLDSLEPYEAFFRTTRIITVDLLQMMRWQSALSLAKARVSWIFALV